MKQLDPAASVDPQAFVPVVMAKSPGLVPANVGVIPVSVALPVLESVTANAVLVEPTTWPVNVTELGDNPAMGAGGAVPVPVTLKVTGETPKELELTVIVSL